MTLARSAPGALAVTELDSFIAAAIEQHVPHVLGKFDPGCLDVEGIVPGERLDELEVVLVTPVPATHRATGEREVRMQDDAQRVEELLHTEAVAAWAGSPGIVKGEQLRLERRHPGAPLPAGGAAAKNQPLMRTIT